MIYLLQVILCSFTYILRCFINFTAMFYLLPILNIWNFKKSFMFQWWNTTRSVGPHCETQIASLKKIQRFALKLCCINWKYIINIVTYHRGYNCHHLRAAENSLKYYHIYSRLKLALSFFQTPPSPASRLTPDWGTTLLDYPVARTSAYKHSFFPDRLTEDTHTCVSLPGFKQLVKSCL